MKGRFNEEDAGALKSVNQGARELYYPEVQGLIGFLNKDVSEEQPKLYVPDIKFRRGIGEYKEKPFSVTGDALDEEVSARHLQEALPTQNDREELRKITREADWIAAN